MNAMVREGSEDNNKNKLQIPSTARNSHITMFIKYTSLITSFRLNLMDKVAYCNGKFERTYDNAFAWYLTTVFNTILVLS